MAIKITEEEVKNALATKDRLMAQVANLRERSQEAIGQVVQTLEVSIVSFGFGFGRGRWGSVDVVGVPADLGVGVLTHIAGFMGLGGKNAEHLHNLGDGALASYFNTLGSSIGVDMANKAGTPAKTGYEQTAGAPPQLSPGGQWQTYPEQNAAAMATQAR